MLRKEVLFARRSPMARILLTTHGSSGDVNPFIALGIELRARGHQVKFAVTNEWKSSLHKEGFSVTCLPREHTDFPGVAASAFHILFPMLQSAQPTRNAVAHLRERTEALRVACSDADLFVAASSQIVASTVADLTHTPWASVVLMPLALPSAYFSPVPLPFELPPPFNKVANRVSWTIGGTFLRLFVDRIVNMMRRTYALPPRRNLLFTGNLSQQLTAVALSSIFLPQPVDWPKYVHMTGFCFWDATTTWHEPQELRAFLSDPTPIVAISSGSMSPTVSDAFADFYHTSIAAVRNAGARALVVGAAPSVLPTPLPEGVLALPFAPFSHIYPHCVAVIHHGGVGSIAQALRAGKPMLVVPWGFDQFLLGKRVADIGVGEWVNRKQYTVNRASKLVTTLLANQRYTQQAQVIATQLARENGVVALCDQIEVSLQHR
jgi:UDP:flavonoid glycosyltransferase YjiC (YdhE family)